MFKQREMDWKAFVNLPDGVRVLTSEDEYRTEGTEMGHCVGGYWHFSMNVILALNVDGERSTAEIEMNPFVTTVRVKGWPRVIQHMAPKNKKCSDLHKQIILDYLKSLG